MWSRRIAFTLARAGFDSARHQLVRALGAGESRTVSFALGAEDLAFYTPRGAWEAEPGEFQVFVGTSSETVKTCLPTLLVE